MHSIRETPRWDCVSASHSRIMKKFVTLLFLLTSAFCATDMNAQIQFPNRKLQKENEQLRACVDSLRNVIEQLRMTCEQEELVSEENPTVEYTAELTDSLIGEWYQNTRIDDYAFDESMTLDSLRFTSNIPDSIIIKRLEAINSYIQVPYNNTVRNYIILYSEKMPTAMGRVLGESKYYMPIFEETFARYHMPLELKYMAIIESMLNPTAESRVGARGMWQFMYQTGRQYGLKINSFTDDRLDVEKAVDAAARYLSDAYQIFGDWNLAISSYNCGIGNVNKAIRRAGRRDFWSIYPYLPRETRGYVPAFVGAMYAMNYYREYGIVPQIPSTPVAVDTFMVTRNLHFKQINEVVGIPVEDLSRLNPQYVHQIIPGSEGPCVLKIPYTWSNAFMDVNPDSLYKHKADTLLSPQIIKNIQASGSETRIAYKVKSGDYLGRIATRYHVTVNQLMKWNHLRSTNLRVGQVLYIYRNGAAPVESSASTSSSSSSSSSSGSASYVTYTVKSGDSFYLIAKRYPGISAQDIMNYNGISSSKLRPGMKIKIPVKK